MSHRGYALATVVSAALLDAGLGVAFAHWDRVPVPDGLYWAVTTATTTGYGDVPVRGAVPHLIAVAVMLTVVPLFAATFSLFTSGLTAVHVEKAEKEVKAHVERRLDWHLGGRPPVQRG